MTNRFEGMTAREVMESKGLNFQVGLTDIQTRFGRVVDKKALCNLSTGKCYEVVGNRYAPIQNEEVFTFFDDAIGEGKAQYTAAGTFQEGKIVYMYIKLPDTIRIKGTDDIIQKNAVLYAKHGSGAVRIASTPFRLICSNQLNATIKNSHFKIGHYRDYERKLEHAKNALRDIDYFYNKFGEIADGMAHKQLNAAEVSAYFKQVTLTKAEQESGKISTRNKNIRESLEGLFVHGRGHDTVGVRGTLWAAFNAVAEFTDHHQSLRKSTDRNESVLIGSGARMKQKSMDEALLILTP